MGAVKIDIKKDYIEWGFITFSDPNTVKGLIKKRVKYDPLFERDNDDINMSSCDLDTFNFDILHTYIDLDNLINNCDFNDKQKIILDMYMHQYTEQEIAEELEDDIRNINGIINSICKKIVDENLRNWRKVIYKNKFQLKEKKCSKCGENLPGTDEFFYAKYDNKDNLHNICIKCIKS